MVVAESCDNEVKVNKNEIKNSNEAKTLTLSVESILLIRFQPLPDRLATFLQEFRMHR